MSESITNSHSFQPSEEAFVFFGLSQNLLSNGRCVLSTIALSKNKKRMFAFNTYLLEASHRILVKFIQGCIEIVGQLSHISNIGLGIAGICVAETCSDGLVNKNYVIISHPRIVVAYDIEGLGITGCEPERTELKEVA